MQKYQSNARSKVLTPETLNILRTYDWPGNVRQLENAVQRAIALSQGDKIFPDSLPPQIFKPGNGVSLPFDDFLEEKLADFLERKGELETGNTYSMVMQFVEKLLLSLVLKKTSDNQVHASKLLGISRNTLRKKILQLKIPLSFDDGNDEGQERD
jgi:two-component system nitrogen regulation response regulator GlnG